MPIEVQIPYGLYRDQFTKSVVPATLEAKIPNLMAKKEQCQQQISELKRQLEATNVREVKARDTIDKKIKQCQKRFKKFCNQHDNSSNRKAEYFRKVRDKAKASQPRTPWPRTAYAEVRHSESNSDVLIITGVFDAPATHRLLITHSEDGTLVCQGRTVTVVDLFENFDVLIRCGRFVDCMIDVLGIKTRKGDSNNLKPLDALLPWWNDLYKKTMNRANELRKRKQDHEKGLLNVLAQERVVLEKEIEELEKELKVLDALKVKDLKIDEEKLKKAPEWIRDAVESRRNAVDKDKPIPRIECEEYLSREMFWDESLSKLILEHMSFLRKYRHIGDLELVQDIVTELARSSFRNGTKLARANIDSWYGWAMTNVPGEAERLTSATTTGKRSRPGHATKQATKLLEQAKDLIPASAKNLEEILQQCGGDKSNPANAQRELNRSANSYVNAKKNFVIANCYIVIQELQRSLSDRALPEQRQRAFMALLRAEDAWCEGNREYGSFAALVRHLLPRHLTGDSWEPTHRWDREILAALDVQNDSGITTEQFSYQAETDAGSLTGDPTIDAESRELLDRLMDEAKLNSRERKLVLERYATDDSTSNEKLSSETKAVFKKLKKAAEEGQRTSEARQ